MAIVKYAGTDMPSKSSLECCLTTVIPYSAADHWKESVHNIDWFMNQTSLKGTETWGCPVKLRWEMTKQSSSSIRRWKQTFSTTNRSSRPSINRGWIPRSLLREQMCSTYRGMSRFSVSSAPSVFINRKYLYCPSVWEQDTDSWRLSRFQSRNAKLRFLLKHSNVNGIEPRIFYKALTETSQQRSVRVILAFRLSLQKTCIHFLASRRILREAVGGSYMVFFLCFVIRSSPN